MSSVAYSSNLVAVVQVLNTGARYQIELTQPPKNGNCWVIGSSSAADINVGNWTPGTASKHIGVDVNHDGTVVVKIFAARHTLLKYQSKDEYDMVDNSLHECYGIDSPHAPAWVVSVNHPVHVFLGETSFSNRAIEVVIESFDHAEHLDDYLAAVQRLKSSAPIMAAELNGRTLPRLQPPQLGPVPSMPGTVTSLSRRLENIGVVTPAPRPRNTVVTDLEKKARDAGLYTHSFLQVITRNNIRTPSSARVVRVFCTRTGNVYAGKRFRKAEMPRLDYEAKILQQLKDSQASHVTTFIEQFLVPAEDPRQNILITEYCLLGSIVEESQRKWFTYHEVILIIDQIAQALHHLHTQQRIVHRDVRPQHILVRSRAHSDPPRLTVCLTNFGSSLQIPTIITNGTTTIDLQSSTLASLTYHDLHAPNDALTDPYLAPNYFSRSGRSFFAHVKNPEKVDIWSLGVVALELLTGGLPIITYETEEDRQRPVLVKDQLYTQLVLKYIDELAGSEAAEVEAGLVRLVVEMLRVECWERISAGEVVEGMRGLVELLEGEEVRGFYGREYPGGQFPVVMAPVVKGGDVWGGR